MIKTDEFNARNTKKTKIREIVKLTILFLVAGVNICSAVNSYSQTTRLTFKIDNKTIEEAFSQIEKRSEFIFFYYDDAIDVNKKVSLNAENQTVEEVLDALLKVTNSTYKISDRQIYISKKATPAATRNPGKISGIVKSVDNEALVGVTVSIKGTTITTITDLDGRFEIYLPEVISDRS